MNRKFMEYLKNYTDANDEELEAAVDRIPVGYFKKGEKLITQGDWATRCFFVFQGCVRQYIIDEEGNEITSQFYTEHQSIAVFGGNGDIIASPYTFECMEDSFLLVGELEQQEDMYEAYPFLESLVRRMVEENMGNMMAAHVDFIGASPEKRYLDLLETRPDLMNRVPQHQLASYLGIKPESLSRIKKRVESQLRAVD